MCRSKWVFVPLISVMGLDFCFTLVGQPNCYWEGLHNSCVETSPIGRAFLKAGPEYFISAYVVYVVIVCLMVGRLRDFIDTAFVMGLIMGHAWGSSTWLPNMFYTLFRFDLGPEDLWYLHVGYFMFISILCGIFLPNRKR